MVYLFIDTNIFLHFTYFEDIPWKQLTSGDDFTLLIAPVVLDELDKHKRNPNAKISARAKRALSRIEEIATSPKSYPLQYWEHRPNSKTLDTYHLDRNEKDDLLLASIIEFTERISENTILVSYDTGPLLRAKTVKIKAVKMDSLYLLPVDQSEEEKTIVKLKKELNALKNALPKIQLTFQNATQLLDLELNPITETKEDYITQCHGKETDIIQKLNQPASPSTKPETQQEERRTDLEATMIKISDFNEIFNQLTKDQVEEYNKELEQYKLDYRAYLEQRHAWERFISLSFAIELMVSNVGTTPAEDIDIWMHFPNGFKLIDENDFPAKPNPPKTPYKPKNKFDFDMTTLSAFGQRSFSSLGRPFYAPPINPNKPDIRETNSYEVKVALKSLKHYHSFTIDPLIVVFEAPENISNFQIDYRIIVGNLPYPVEGKLNVKISQPVKKD